MDRVNIDLLRLDRPKLYYHQWQSWGGISLERFRRASGEGTYQLDCHRIFLSLSPQARSIVDVDGRRVLEGRMPKHRLAFVPAGAKVWWCGTPGDSVNIFHSPKIYEDILTKTGVLDVEFRHLVSVDDNVLLRIILAITEEIESDDSVDRLFVEFLGHALAIRIIQRLRVGDTVVRAETPDMGHNRLRRVCDYIDANIAVGDLSLNELADVSGLSRFHLIRAFRRETGMTPHQYVMQLRVMRAKQLIPNIQLSLAEISSAVGFGSYSRFTIYFRKITGMTPIEYRSHL
jgi:AraC family transcriptional regulator